MTAKPRIRSVIQRKLEPPPLPDRLVARPRLDEMLNGLIRSRRVLWVCATAGAGKTTAIATAARASRTPAAWLTLDATDAAPGRLLTYLEASLARRLPDLSGIASRALAARIPHEEAAGLLAEAVQKRTLFVIDDVEKIGDSPRALSVIGSLIRYAPKCLRVVLISRCEVALDLRDQASPATPARVGEAELAFTIDEAAAALAKAGDARTDPARAVEATGGWVTGVLFEAWRSAAHVSGLGGEADPLHGYLSSQILGQLDDEEREFLIVTSVLDAVTCERAQLLGRKEAGRVLTQLRAKHLPVSWEADDGSFRFHSRFREFLLECLGRRDLSEVQAVRRAHARVLVAENHWEEAAEELLGVGLIDEAGPAIERAIEGVAERLDFAVAERWLESVPSDANPALTLAVAELMVAIGQEQYWRGASVGDRLQLTGQRQQLLESFEQAATMLAWCYFHVGRIDDAAATGAAVEGSSNGDLVRYLLTLVVNGPERPIPDLDGGPLDGLLLRLHWAHGHLKEVQEVPASRWAASVSGPWRVAGLRASGHTEEALELLEKFRSAEHDSGLLDIVGAEAMIDLGRREEAWASLARGRSKIQSSGSVFLLLMSFVIEAKLELRLRGDARRATEVLRRLELHPAGRTYRFICEQADAWTGMALLLQHSNDDARQRLRGAVDSMLAGDRILELPTAGVYLAEAEWRLDNEGAADDAADLALHGAERQGSHHMLLQALADFPEVVARRMDAESARDSTWHGLARSLLRKGLAAQFELGGHVELSEFGRVAVSVNGSHRQPRIKKSYELLAYLIANPNSGGERSEILDALFDGRADESTRAYLRQAVNQLRDMLPDGLDAEHGRVALPASTFAGSESRRFEALLEEASRLLPEDRLQRTLAALEICDQGDYLPGLRSQWVETRREHLFDLASDARVDAAELAFRHGRYKTASELLDTLLKTDPFRESAWRLRIRLCDAVGDQDRLIRTYQRCQAALRDVGLAVSSETRRLVEELQR